ncbi:hypothetical protein McanMca71_003797 [Microsporum canis]|uniref:DUF636 domain-containing protein n=1 Tax=Arthroderma otae (strain ATCC MYA-4605 / CBS 113480) TaxID=554155 RepID=C5FT83_ARTOC|nr:DUF636 domain-containing protein [Microsporum canis CBS 113480]EEQ33086.1 DUF636 domain-containing protein [Microsporum canis CBS 113480]
MTSSASREPYRGSCRCGHIRYVAYITLPPAISPEGKVDRYSSVHFYKCNCTACLKFGLFHMRLPKATEDFYLLSPLEPEKELTDYKILEAGSSWYFCPTCGVRCFSFRGKGKVEDVELEEWVTKPADMTDTKAAAAAGGEGSKKITTKAWRIEKEGWDEGKRTSYLSINVQTLEPEDGLDLRELVDKKWLGFIDCREFKEKQRFDRPQTGGSW